MKMAKGEKVEAVTIQDITGANEFLSDFSRVWLWRA